MKAANPKRGLQWQAGIVPATATTPWRSHPLLDETVRLLLSLSMILPISLAGISIPTDDEFAFSSS